MLSRIFLCFEASVAIPASATLQCLELDLQGAPAKLLCVLPHGGKLAFSNTGK